MPKSKGEVRSYLLSQVKKSISPEDGDLQGQCVSLVKGLMAFVGAPNPRAARGHAATAGNQYIREGIGRDGARVGRGWLTVCINPNMAPPFGHIWVDVNGEFNIEQNGAVKLTVTQNTRPLSQATQLVNFDQWVVAASAPPPVPAPPPPALEDAVKQRIIWDAKRKQQHFVYLVPGVNNQASLWIKSYPSRWEPRRIDQNQLLDDRAGLEVALVNDGDQLSVFCRGASTAPYTGRHFWSTGDLGAWNWQNI